MSNEPHIEELNQLKTKGGLSFRCASVTFKKDKPGVIHTISGRVGNENKKFQWNDKGYCSNNKPEYALNYAHIGLETTSIHKFTVSVMNDENAFFTKTKVEGSMVVLLEGLATAINDSDDVKLLIKTAIEIAPLLRLRNDKDTTTQAELNSIMADFINQIKPKIRTK